MRRIVSRIVSLGLVLGLTASAAHAQISVPYPTFQPGNVILAEEANANNSTLGSQALNRTGGTMTGPLVATSITASAAITGTTLTLSGALTGTTGNFSGGVAASGLTSSGNVLPGSSNTYDLGSSLFRWDDLFIRTIDLSNGFGSSVLPITTATYDLGSSSFRWNGIWGTTLNISGASTLASLAVSGNATVGGTLGVTGVTTLGVLGVTSSTSIGGTLGVVGTTTLQAALGGTSATFSGTVTGNLFSGSGASLTAIPETAITNGALLARVADNETISGTWTFSSGTLNIAASAGGSLFLNRTGAIADEKNWLVRNGASTAFQITACNDALNACADALTVTRTGAIPTAVSFGAPLVEALVQSITTSAGSNTLTLNTTTQTVFVTVAAGANDIATVVNGFAGRRLRICTVNTGSGGTLSLSFADAGAFGTLAKGHCMTYWYNGTSNTWYLEEQ